MQLDQKTLQKLLSMNDEQLGTIIQNIANESGIDSAQLGLNPNNIASIRQALGSATEADLAQLNVIYESYRQNKKNK